MFLELRHRFLEKPKLTFVFRNDLTFVIVDVRHVLDNDRSQHLRREYE